jgi:hypothetical protein
MDQDIPIMDSNLFELEEENEVKKIDSKPSQIPIRHLRNIKKVNYSKFFSEDPDNSEEYIDPEEHKQKNESVKKRQRPKSVLKSENDADTNKKKKEEKAPDTEHKMKVEEENQDKNNKNKYDYSHIINIEETLSKYTNNNTDNNNTNNIEIPNSDLILIMLEICLNSSKYGLDKDNSSRAFWEDVGKLKQLKPITDKFKTETLRKYWRTFREAKKYKKIISETKRYKDELNNNNLKLLSSIRVICEYVSSPSKKRIEYFLDKHIVKPANKNKKINVNDMPPSEQISEVINTFVACFPRKKEKEIIDVLLQTSFDIQNAFLVLKDKEHLGFFSFSEKDDEIVKKNYEDKDDKNEEYQELVNIKGLEDVIRRKEFLFNVKIDRSQYIENEKELEVVDMDNKKEEKEENKNKNEDKNENKEENLKEENKDNNKEEKNENKDIDNNKTKEEDKIKETS